MTGKEIVASFYHSFKLHSKIVRRNTKSWLWILEKLSIWWRTCF